MPAPTATGGTAQGATPATGVTGGASGFPLETGQSDQGAALRGLGESRRRQGQFAEAITFFTQALTLNPNDVPARVGRADPGRLLRRSGVGVFWALVVGVVAARAVYFNPDLLGKLGEVAALSKRLCAVFV